MDIIILGEPVPQGRPRARRAGNFIQMYDPPKSKQYKKIVSEVAKKQWKHGILEGALEVKLDIYRPIPKSVSKKRRKEKESKTIRPIVRPDVDNYAKSVLDGLDKIVWQDDSQIVSLITNKYYSDNPRVEISVKQLF